MTSFSTTGSHRLFQLLLLISATLSAFYVRTTLGPLQETMRLALGLNDNQMALLQGPPLAIGVVAAVPFGLIIDRGFRVQSVWIFALVGVLASVLTAWTSHFSWLFISRCLAGLSASVIWTAVLSLIAEWFPPAQRGRATMAVSIGAVAGMSGAFALGGFFLGVFSEEPDSWRWAMSALVAPLLLVSALTLLMRNPTPTLPVAQRTSARDIYRQLWGHRTVLFPLAVGFALVAGIADGAVVIWAAPMLSRTFALTPVRIGAIMGSILLFNGLVGPFLGGLLADLGQHSGGPRRTVKALTVLLVLSIPAGLFALATSATAASIMLALFLVSGTAFQVALLALTTIVVPQHLRASCLAFFTALSLVFAFGAAPLLVSELSTVLGGPGMIGKSLMMVCVTSASVGALIFGLASRKVGASQAEGVNQPLVSRRVEAGILK